jgi:antitoxin (DNA-binding transcriptional repressor) of toxin-antitoxin stability system
VTTAGLRELKNRLGHYLTLVAQGQTVLVTRHGQVVARILREPDKEPGLRDRLKALAATGEIHLPRHRRRSGAPVPLKSEGKSLSDIVSESRR